MHVVLNKSHPIKRLPWVSLVAQMVKNLPAMQETWVQSLGWKDPLEKEMAIHSNILAWKIPWKEEPDRLQSMGSQRVRHDLVTKSPPALTQEGPAFATAVPLGAIAHHPDLPFLTLRAALWLGLEDQDTP